MIDDGRPVERQRCADGARSDAGPMALLRPWLTEHSRWLGVRGQARVGLVLRALVVDDEEPARKDLVWMLDRESCIGDVYEAGGGAEALKLLTRNEQDARFDVVFLDMKMPDLDGLDIARMIDRFEEPPAIVFVTAFDTPASDAFDLGIIDYLRKPVAADRLGRALERVRAARGERRDPDLQTDRLAVSTQGGRQVLLRPIEVSHFESSGDYVRVHTHTESFLVRDTMARLTDAWSRHGFLRIHRGFSVRMSAVDEVRTSSSGRCVVVNDTEIPVSRRYARELTVRLTGDRGSQSPQ